jgi:hypothetical protein
VPNPDSSRSDLVFVDETAEMSCRTMSIGVLRQVERSCPILGPARVAQALRGRDGGGVAPL